VPLPAWLRRVRRYFGISAPRMAVRTHLPWPWRVGSVVLLLSVIAGMWWWGFDFGQIFGGFNRQEVELQVAGLQGELARVRSEAAELRTKNSWLASELAMKEGAQATQSRQIAELQNENAQVKEELGFLQKLFADANRQEGLSIARFAVEPMREDSYHYSLLVVRGGNPKADFEGTIALQVAMQAATADGSALRPIVLTLPDEQPTTAPALKLKFKYYQRVEGSFRVPPGTAVRTVTARAFEAGQPGPRATRTLNLQ
jgi:hypothetical protein